MKAGSVGNPRSGGTARRQLNRRAFVRLAGSGALAGALGLPALLSACGAQSGGTSSGSAKRAGLKLPAYIAAKGPTPDYPGNAQGLEPGYTTFPKDLYKSVTESPSKGGDITSLVQVSVLPNPVEKNPAWQQINRQLGANLKMLMVPQADYASKWATITAGNDLPDLMYIPQVPALPNVSAFTKAACADLTAYLSGDAVKDYPNLANFTPASWRVTIRNNAIYGVPIVRYLVGPLMYVQQNLLDAIGAPQPKNGDDFKRICKDLSNPKAGKWAMGHTNDSTAGPYSMLFFQGMFRAPNNWRVDQNGKMVKDIETEEYKQALAYSRDLVQAGYISPDIKPNAGLNDDFFSGKIAMRANAWGNYSVAYAAASQKLKINIRAVQAFAADGGKPGFLLGVGNFGFSVIKKGSADRVKEMLRMLNYLAGPFGSEEYMATKFGVKGTDYNFDAKGNPVVTEQGNADVAVHSWDYLATAPSVAFSAYQPEFGHYGHDEEAAFLAAGISDPSSGRYSPTDEDKGVQLNQMIFDRVSSIAAGRALLTDLDQLVKDWRSQGGDQIRSEFEQSAQIS